MGTPEWITRMDDDDVAGEDHLGVEGAAQGYQQYLGPASSRPPIAHGTTASTAGFRTVTYSITPARAISAISGGFELHMTSTSFQRFRSH